MREHFNEILAFQAVANERSFTKAAAKAGVTQSALSHAVRALEARLGVRLLTRTTRSVSVTQAGERLLQSVSTGLAEIEAGLAAVNEFSDKISGTVRITAIDHVVDSVIWPRVSPLLHRHPNLHIEINSEYRMVDIAAERYDIGVRWGNQIEKDMVAQRITPDTPMGIFGSPQYLQRFGEPLNPQDLVRHNCITLRLASRGAIYAWELRQDHKAIEVKVGGQTCFTSAYPMLLAALSGNGLAFLPLDMVQSQLTAGQLRRVLPEYCPDFPGLHAYYTNRRHPGRAMRVVLDALRQLDPELPP
jgi:DNA-binding transcriptional LysR family regulator